MRYAGICMFLIQKNPFLEYHIRSIIFSYLFFMFRHYCIDYIVSEFVFMYIIVLYIFILEF